MARVSKRDQNMRSEKFDGSKRLEEKEKELLSLGQEEFDVAEKAAIGQMP